MIGERTVHLVDAELLEPIDPCLVEHRAGRNDDLLAVGIQHVLGDDATEHAVRERLDHVAALDERDGREQAVLGAAVDFGDHEVLGDVDQTTRQVTRVGRLQRRVREDPCAHRGWR